MPIKKIYPLDFEPKVFNVFDNKTDTIKTPIIDIGGVLQDRTNDKFVLAITVQIEYYLYGKTVMCVSTTSFSIDGQLKIKQPLENVDIPRFAEMACIAIYNAVNGFNEECAAQGVQADKLGLTPMTRLINDVQTGKLVLNN